jgi:hypothetical protein
VDGLVGFIEIGSGISVKPTDNRIDLALGESIGSVVIGEIGAQIVV